MLSDYTHIHSKHATSATPDEASLTMSRRSFLTALLTTASFALPTLVAQHPAKASDASPTLLKQPAIVMRTTENVPEGSWVWFLEAARDAGVGRIYLLVKQDENNFVSKRTARTLKSGELLIPVTSATVAEGWDDPAWLDEFLPRAKSYGIEVHAWWPCFQDSVAAVTLPHARLPATGNDVFIDPAFPEVGAYQAKRLKALLERYPFDGVALDWLRYNDRTNGAAGPLGEHFHEYTGKAWTAAAMKDPLSRAIWDDLRARNIATWVKDLLDAFRPQFPTVSWGAFVLPWTFKEVAQSYRHLSNAGLDSLLPMIYWRDWKYDVSFVSETVSPTPFVLSGRTSLDPVFDITMSEADLTTAMDYLPADRLGHVTFYHHGEWSEADFQKLAKLTANFNNARRAMYAAAPAAASQAINHRHLAAAQFSPDAAFWAVICLGELYRRDALDHADPIVPVLAFHRFSEGVEGSGATNWHTSTAYVDAIIAFMTKHKFNTVPIDQLAAYMTSDDASTVPPRPLCITIDDGSASIADLFEPRAAAAKLPYAIGLVTSWVGETKAQIIDQGGGIVDSVLTWQQVKALSQTGRVQMISHSHEQHRYAKSGPTGGESGPAFTTRLWIDAEQRRETEPERLRRVFNDMVQSSTILSQRTGKPANFFVWPYGLYDASAEAAGKDAGFTHFFEFGGNAFAAPRRTPNRIARVSIMLADEAIPVAFPDDDITAQRWWLAFQRWARATQSTDLIEAGLAQLAPEQRDHPEVLISNAAISTLNGHSILAMRQLEALRSRYPHDGSVHSAVDDFLVTYQGLV